MGGWGITYEEGSPKEGEAKWGEAHVRGERPHESARQGKGPHSSGSRKGRGAHNKGRSHVGEDLVPLPYPGGGADFDSQTNFITSKTVNLDSQTNFNTSTTSDDLSHCFCFVFDLIRGRRNAGDHQSGGRAGLKPDFVFFYTFISKLSKFPIFCLRRMQSCKSPLLHTGEDFFLSSLCVWKGARAK